MLISKYVAVGKPGSQLALQVRTVMRGRQTAEGISRLLTTGFWDPAHSTLPPNFRTSKHAWFKKGPATPSRFFFFNLCHALFIYLFYGCVGSLFLCEGLLQLWQAGATLHRGARASHRRGLSCCGAQAPDAQAQQLWLKGPAAPRPVGSSQTRARTRVPCIGRQTLNHCATREAPPLPIFNHSRIRCRIPKRPTLREFSDLIIWCAWISLPLQLPSNFSFLLLISLAKAAASSHGVLEFQTA